MINKKIALITALLTFTFTANAQYFMKQKCSDCEFVVMNTAEANTSLTEQEVTNLLNQFSSGWNVKDSDDYMTWTDRDDEYYTSLESIVQNWERKSSLSINNSSNSIPALKKLTNIELLAIHETDVNIADNLNNSNIQILSMTNSDVSFDDTFNYSSVKKIWLRDYSNTNFPDLHKFTDLEELEIYSETLTTLPNLSYLTNLRALTMQTPNVVDMPLGLALMDAIEKFSIQSAIKSFGDVLIQMSSLKDVDISNNPVEEISVEFCNKWKNEEYKDFDSNNYRFIESFCVA